MDLIETYSKIKKSIVAICLNMLDCELPPIIGTGFFIKESGIVLTNKHVIEELAKFAEKIGKADISEVAMVLYFTTTETATRIAPLCVSRAGKVQWNEEPGKYYGEDPDVGFLELQNVKDCPTLKIYEGEIQEGQDVCIAGFPMGTRTLKAPGWVHQIGPTLQKGIISAVLPFPCKSPHAILMDIMSQGGSSGSPVFLPESGELIGILYAGLNDHYKLTQDIPYKIPTSLSLAVPKKVIQSVLATIEKDANFISEDKKTPLEEWLKKQTVHEINPKDGLGMMAFSKE